MHALQDNVEPPEDGSDCVVGVSVPCRLGLRVELIPPIHSQGVGTVTEVRRYDHNDPRLSPFVHSGAADVPHVRTHARAISSLRGGGVGQVREEGTAVVTWDNAKVHSCRVGLLGEFWLRVSFAPNI